MVYPIYLRDGFFELSKKHQSTFGTYVEKHNRKFLKAILKDTKNCKKKFEKYRYCEADSREYKKFCVAFINFIAIKNTYNALTKFYGNHPIKDSDCNLKNSIIYLFDDIDAMMRIIWNEWHGQGKGEFYSLDWINSEVNKK